jgi:hypothetical protein
MAQLEELAARLAAPDAIMEPSAKATLRSFLTLGGGAAAAERAVDLLSSRYRGAPAKRDRGSTGCALALR